MHRACRSSRAIFWITSGFKYRIVVSTTILTQVTTFQPVGAAAARSLASRRRAHRELPGLFKRIILRRHEFGKLLGACDQSLDQRLRRGQLDYDQAFHYAIAGACGNKRLSADIRRYRMMHHAFNVVVPKAEDLKHAAAEHRDILDAITERNGARARSTMFSHISHCQDYFFRNYPS